MDVPTNETFCICNLPDDGRLYIDCEGGCLGWYHASCVGLGHMSADELNEYTLVCTKCKVSEANNLHQAKINELEELITKKNMVIVVLESGVQKEKEKAQIKVSVLVRKEEQQKLEMENQMR